MKCYFLFKLPYLFLLNDFIQNKLKTIKILFIRQILHFKRIKYLMISNSHPENLPNLIPSEAYLYFPAGHYKKQVFG